MNTPLVPVTIDSIYRGAGMRTVMLPARMALATPDTRRALYAIRDEVQDRGGVFRLSDLYRTSEDQERAFMDWKEKRKKAYSPPAGGSWHEAGRAFDVDIDALKPVSMAELHAICAKHGVTPIESEAWHFECRGSHGTIAAQDRQGYKAGVESAILALGLRVKRLHGRLVEAGIQADLHRLGADPGPLDGVIGRRTKAALVEAGVPAWADLTIVRKQLDHLVAERFPGEYNKEDN